MRVLAAAGADALVVTGDGTTALKAAMGYRQRTHRES
jgi:hypothetical protein